VLLVLVLLKHLVLEPLGGFGALGVDVCGPKVGDGVFDDEEGRDGHGPDEPVRRPGNVVLDSFALAVLWLLNVVGCSAESVDQAREADLHDRSVRKVHGETVAANPHEEFVREHALQRR
jgi:hypothetical protein